MALRWLGLVAAVVAIEASAQGPGASMPTVRFELVGKVEDRPLLVTNDGAGRTFVVEQPGRVSLISGGKISEKPFLDMTEMVYAEGECGLLGLAFHPKFAENGL